MAAMRQHKHRTAIIIAWLMIALGIAEIVTAFTHDFFGIHTAQGATSTYAGAAIGAFYAAAGALVLTMKRSAAILAIVFLAIVVAGRIFLVATGLFPVPSLLQAIAMATGTLIVIGFALYLGLNGSVFR
jgi:hypothetical protein